MDHKVTEKLNGQLDLKRDGPLLSVLLVCGCKAYSLGLGTEVMSY